MTNEQLEAVSGGVCPSCYICPECGSPSIDCYEVCAGFDYRRNNCGHD